MSVVHVSDEYQIPRGRVYFDPFDINGATTGEEEFGNCPSFTVKIETDKLEHFKATTGLKEKDDSRVVQVNRTASVTCDNVSLENLAKFISGQVEDVSQTNTAVTDHVMAVVPGRFYQLGQSSSNPTGDRNISTLVVENSGGGTTYDEGDDYNVDLVKGRLQIVDGGAIVAGNIQVSYAKAAKTWKRVSTGDASELKGAVRVIADNAGSTNRDYYFPSCVLKPSGDLPVIAGDAKYVEMQFDLEVLTPANGSAIYLDDAPLA